MSDGTLLIRTPDQRLRVFISSTLDLVEERGAVRRSVESLGLIPVMFEAGARPHAPRALYRAYVEQSDVFVAIYAGRYGWTAPGMAVSGLEDEFDLSHGKPRLVYLQAAPAREPRLAALLERIGDAGLSFKPFSSATELERLVRDDLAHLLSERWHTSGGEGARLSSRPAPVPVPRSAILGRRGKLEALERLLQLDDVRLVTLVGPGGVGKTRLAIECARRLRASFPGGTYFVALSALREPDLLADTIAGALGVAPGDASPAGRAVADLIGDRHVLLVLDNVEQVLAGVPTVVELLEACERLTVLVTSRSPLRVRGEHEVAVPPLMIPAEGDDEVVTGSPAVQLFLEAARARRPEFELDERSTAAVVAICRHLDGLPLAIELAAAMARVLPPDAILDRLQQGLDVVGPHLRDVPARHRTVGTAIAWSYELLDEPTRQAFAQLSVFRGGFTLASAARVCDVPGDLLEEIATLTEHSLLRAEVGRETRFSMLSTIRRYAGERLDADGEGSATRARHAEAFLALCDAVGRPGGRGVAPLDAVEAELDDVRASFEWALSSGRADGVADAMWASWWFWWTRGHLTEARRWADLAAGDPALSRGARGRVLAARAMLGIWSGEYDRTVAAFEEAREIAGDLEDRHILGYADIGLGLVHGITASVSEGSVGIRRGIATLEQQGDEQGAMTGLVALSWLQAITRQLAGADDVIRDALRRAARLGADVETGLAESAHAQLRLSHGDVADAIPLLASSLDRLAAARHVASTILTLEVIAEVALAEGLARSAVILGATAALRASLGTRVPPQARARLDRMVDHGHRAVSGFAVAFGQGSRRGFGEAVQEGRAVLEALAASAPSGRMDVPIVTTRPSAVAPHPVPSRERSDG